MMRLMSGIVWKSLLASRYLEKWNLKMRERGKGGIKIEEADFD